MRRATAFLDAVRRSRRLHGRWARPPATREQYQAFVRRARKPAYACHFVCTDDGDLAGVINISEIVRGAFCSGYLGYYAFEPHAGGGHMHLGLAAVLRLAFRQYKLHRLEANIQPDNARSIALVREPRLRARGLLAALLEDRRSLARPRALGADGRNVARSSSACVRSISRKS